MSNDVPHSTNRSKPKVAIVGGGPAGFFSAIEIASNPDIQVVIYEALPSVLEKVKISGGGRCNVTHFQFDTKALSLNYPRGEREMLGPFSVFNARDTVQWFENRDVRLKVESDGRMFPKTDDSMTIVNALVQTAKQRNIQVLCSHRIMDIQIDKGSEVESGSFVLQIQAKDKPGATSLVRCDCVLLACGSSRKAYEWAKALGHRVQDPVPSLFSFTVTDPRLDGLAGISVPDVEIELIREQPKKDEKIGSVPGGEDPLMEEQATSRAKSKSKGKPKPQQTKGLVQRGDLLITHWGFSGPAALRLSSYGARIIHDLEYHFAISINWIPSLSKEQIMAEFRRAKKLHGTKLVTSFCPIQEMSHQQGQDIEQQRLSSALPRRLWKSMVVDCLGGGGDDESASAELRWNSLSDSDLAKLAGAVQSSRFQVLRKGQFKDEFVTCGGIDLRDVNMKTMESKVVPGLYFAGELLDIDAVTGGFNFQGCWTTGIISGRAIASSLS